MKGKKTRLWQVISVYGGKATPPGLSIPLMSSNAETWLGIS